MGAALSFYGPKVCECTADVVANYVVYGLCSALCCFALCFGVIVAIAQIPMPDVTDQPPVLGDYNRIDLASIRYILLEGHLYAARAPHAVNVRCVTRCDVHPGGFLRRLPHRRPWRRRSWPRWPSRRAAPTVWMASRTALLP